MQIIKALPENAGCWIDGHWGSYGIARLIEIAGLNGYDVDEDLAVASRILRSMGPNPDITEPEDWESVVYIADEVEVWMNENVAPEGFSFGWYEGEFFLWPDESWEESY